MTARATARTSALVLGASALLAVAGCGAGTTSSTTATTAASSDVTTTGPTTATAPGTPTATTATDASTVSPGTTSSTAVATPPPGAPAPQGTPPRGGALGGVTRTVTVPPGATAAFVAPAGDVACALRADGPAVLCQVRDAAFDGLPPRSGCAGKSRWVLQVEDGTSGQGCADRPVEQDALLGGPTTSWWQNGRDAYLPATSPAHGRLAVLGRGNRMTAGTLTCTVAQGSVACTDARTGQGFSVSRERYELQR